MIRIKNPAAALLAGLSLVLAARAQEAPAPAKPEAPANSDAPAKPAIREVSPGNFEIGKVRLDQKALTVSFPGKVNMERGLLEYLIVNPRGSAHESLLVTEVGATDIHTAMLLLGAKGGAITAQAPPAQVNDEFLRTAPKLTGDTVLITVKWKDKGVEKTVPVEDWLYNQEKKEAIKHGPWIYNGSIVYEGRFLAQVDGNLVALVTMPSALLNNPRKNNNNDQMWNVNEKATPAVNTPVEIIFKLVPPTNPKPK
jgi:hypothetical protein